MLVINDLNVSYGDMTALWGISLKVDQGELVALVGPNGAGKTTALRAISGLIKTAAGEILLDGASISRQPANKIVERGISQVPEGGRIFTRMTVLENLELGAYRDTARKVKDDTLKWVFGIFPRLEERKNQRAGTLSGGERQMLAIGRGLMSKPRLLMLDEPSHGLSPIMVEHMFDMIAEINRQGVTILLVEQNIRAALDLAHRAYLIENGRIVGQGTANALFTFESVRSAYLG